MNAASAVALATGTALAACSHVTPSSAVPSGAALPSATASLRDARLPDGTGRLELRAEGMPRALGGIPDWVDP